jgi:membrane protein YdbS with pleckstrin-like domain
MNSTPLEDYNKPVAYDTNGQPLYLHPPVAQAQTDNVTQAVHLIRPTEPEKQIISDATRLKHQQSVKTFPMLNLSEGEYVITSVSRHIVGLLLPISLGIFLVVLALVLLFNFDLVIQSFQFTGITISSSIIILPVIIFISLVILGTYVAYFVYANNKLFLTNESIIQEIQTSIFAKRERIVSLMDIEDVSYAQTGVIQEMFNYGSIRLSTEGEGTIYYFKFVANPKQTIAILSNAVESFKNGRAIN